VESRLLSEKLEGDLGVKEIAARAYRGQSKTIGGIDSPHRRTKNIKANQNRVPLRKGEMFKYRRRSVAPRGRERKVKKSQKPSTPGKGDRVILTSGGRREGIHPARRPAAGERPRREGMNGGLKKGKNRDVISTESNAGEGTVLALRRLRRKKKTGGMGRGGGARVRGSSDRKKKKILGDWMESFLERERKVREGPQHERTPGKHTEWGKDSIKPGERQQSHSRGGEGHQGPTSRQECTREKNKC